MDLPQRATYTRSLDGLCRGPANGWSMGRLTMHLLLLPWPLYYPCYANNTTKPTVSGEWWEYECVESAFSITKIRAKRTKPTRFHLTLTMITILSWNNKELTHEAGSFLSPLPPIKFQLKKKSGLLFYIQLQKPNNITINAKHKRPVTVIIGIILRVQPQPHTKLPTLSTSSQANFSYSCGFTTFHLHMGGKHAL